MSVVPVCCRLMVHSVSPWRPSQISGGESGTVCRLFAAGAYHLPPMRIDELLQTKRPAFSVEFFPPKTEEGRRTLFETVETLKGLDPAYFSVTYGAGGATR